MSSEGYTPIAGNAKPTPPRGGTGAARLEGLADVVVLTVKNAMAPVLERLALVERENTDLKDRLAVVTELRDRVVVVETKALTPVTMPPVEKPEPVDLSPVLERLSVVERDNADLTKRLDVVTELRDRVVVVETKSALPVPEPDIDIAPILDSIGKVETRLLEKIGATDQRVTELRDRVIETKAAPTQDGLSATDAELLIRKSLEPVTATIAEARERLIAVETRAPIPGPAGKDGSNGKDGADGQPGRDGLGFDDLDVDFDGDRTLTLKFARGPEKKTWPITLPYLRYDGVFIEGKGYTPGAVVTWAGSTWHANKETTAKPGEGSKDWTLIVKRGRDGKDGKDAAGALPVVSVR